MRARPPSLRILLLALTATGGLSCKNKRSSAPTPKPPVVIGAEDIALARRQEITVGPRISGSLDPREIATVRAEAAGSLHVVKGELGQSVTKGSVLAQIENRAQKDAARAGAAAVTSADRQLRIAEREMDRARALYEGGAVAKQAVDKAASALAGAQLQAQQARAQAASARTQLANTTGRSPIDGVISHAPVHQGDVVAPGSELFTIIDPSSMRLEASVPSENLSLVKVGAAVDFTVRGYPERSFQGRVARVAPAVDPVTQQIPIIVDIPNESGALMAGLFAEGRLATSRRRTLVVPLAAVDRSGEGTTVTRVLDDQVERAPVLLGEQDSGAELVEVLEGVAEGDVLLLRSFRGLTPGTRVSVPPVPSDKAAAVSPAPDDSLYTRREASDVDF